MVEHEALQSTQQAAARERFERGRVDAARAASAARLVR